MVLSTKSFLLIAALAPIAVLGETVLGVTVFSRHGDRTSKHYKGYTLTNLGFQQNYQTGAYYRSIYLEAGAGKQILGISEDQYVPNQIWASAPDQMVLLNTATAFLQGLYPPIGSNENVGVQELNNGTDYTAPLNGYQYVVLHGEDENSPDIIWIKGDENCPAATKDQKSYSQSTQFKDTFAATRQFYGDLYPLMKDVYDYKPENMTYQNAYDIFDLINVASIHNKSFSVEPQKLDQLRALADRSEFGQNYNVSAPDNRSIGGKTLASAILNQLNQTVTGKGKLKFSLLAGSYDTFLSFFGLSDLTKANTDFYGLPVYASTMAFEIFTKDNVTSFPSSTDNLHVRFLFRNGSDDGTPLSQFPLFGQAREGMSWTIFVKEMQKRSINTVSSWCTMCGSTEDFCVAALKGDSASPASAGSSSSSGISNAVAGVIGALVTLGIVAICGLTIFLIRRKRAQKVATTEEAGYTSSISKKNSL
ncbi:hypothetical protein FAUST_7356 [Fusarium austroamericanum]|uniref:Histidine acid phosphatase n=1 Tax=Fusarium austroamericanum TaxID=282268 RepID=A0AAN5Z6L5_FUSAU|nr:hypothetical protein FAUST_7356 [Fusarium austroamericanum]